MAKKLRTLRGRMMRVTELDGCGNVALGPRASVASDGFITVGLTANNDEGEAITQTNAAGRECISDTPVPKFKNWTVAITFCGVEPELFTLITGQPLVYAADGTTPIGFDIESDIDVENLGFALEVWMGVDVDACDEDAQVEYGYAVLPFVKGGSIGDWSIENAAINFSIAGAQTKNGSHWGVGPYDVELDETGAEGPLNTPLSTKNHTRVIPVQVPPPAATDGAVALGVPATGATAGIPATLTPSNSYPPEDLADAATGFTASPTTAWTAGQYVRLGDDTKAHWDGTAWVAGVA